MKKIEEKDKTSKLKQMTKKKKWQKLSNYLSDG